MRARMLAAIDIQLRVTELGKHGRRHVMNVKYDERWPGACVMTISLGNACGAWCKSQRDGRLAKR